MKHITLLAVVALLCVGALAFGDSATVALTGGVEGGAKIVLGDTSTIQQFTNNEGTTGWANLAVAATLGDLSANFYLRSSDFATWTIPNAWVTEKLFNKMVELRAGSIDNGVSGTAYNGWGGLSGVGIQVVVNPVAGMSAGVFLPAPLAAGELVPTLAKFKAGATYSLPNIANIALTFQNWAATGYEIDAGVSITAVPNLSAYIEAQVPNGGTIALTEDASYAMAPLTISLEVYEWLGTEFNMSIAPKVAYAMDIMTVWGKVKYTLKDSVIGPEIGATFAWGPMGSMSLVWNGTFGPTPANVVNIYFVHSF